MEKLTLGAKLETLTLIFKLARSHIKFESNFEETNQALLLI